MDARELLIDAADKYGRKTAYIYQDKEYDFQSLRDNSFRLANSLLDLGFRKNDRIAINLPNCIEYIYSYFALYSLGCIVVPIDFALSLNEIISISNHCGLKGIITTADVKFSLFELKSRISSLKEIITIEDDSRYISFWGLVENGKNDLADQEIDPQMISSIFYTSGTMGKPKGALWNYEHIHLGAEQLKYFTTYDYLKTILRIDKSERTIAAVPLSHSAGILFVMTTVKYGMSHVIMPRFSPLDFIRMVDKWKVTGVFMVPPMYYAILYLKEVESYSLESIRWADVFGAPSSYDLMMRFQKLCPNAVILNGGE
jgi:acyl-CoA synthetase (AMP-forming)/AMP-acid ligase II